jgi:hypothetical protein
MGNANDLPYQNTKRLKETAIKPFFCSFALIVLLEKKKR